MIFYVQKLFDIELCKNQKQKENSGYKKLFSVLMLIVILSTFILGVSARDIDFQDYNIISIYQKFNPAILDGYMTPDDGYGAPLVTLTFEQFHAKWGIDTEPGYENIIDDSDSIPQQVDIYGFYTTDTFYYCLVVKDLVHYNNGHENLYSGGDSVFFNILLTEQVQYSYNKNI